MLAKLKSYFRARQHLKKYAAYACDHVFAWDWSAVGYNRIALVNLLLSRFQSPAYLEIGCQENNLFHSVFAPRKTGVDPERGGNRRMTSDQFFAENRDSFDVIFIDGLHTYEQVRKDLINSLKCLRKNGWIAIHDLLPGNWLEAHVPNISAGAWCGDVWKIAFELWQTSGIDFRIAKIDGGVGVIRVTSDLSPVLGGRPEELGQKRFEYLVENIDALPLVDWNEAVQWIAAAKQT